MTFLEVRFLTIEKNIPFTEGNKVIIQDIFERLSGMSIKHCVASVSITTCIPPNQFYVILTYLLKSKHNLFLWHFPCWKISFLSWYSRFLLGHVILPGGISAACDSSGPFYFKWKKKLMKDKPSFCKTQPIWFGQLCFLWEVFYNSRTCYNINLRAKFWRQSWISTAFSMLCLGEN